MTIAINTKHYSIVDLATVSDPLTPPEDWIIDPQFDDPIRAFELGPTCWIINQDGSIHVKTDTEIDADAVNLATAKINKINEINLACESAIIGGFVSAALGTDHTYDSEEVDQLNLIGSTTATAPTTENPNGTSIYYACRNTTTGVKTYELHSYAQLRQVMNDGAAYKLTQLQKCYMLKLQVAACTLISQVEAIVW